MIQTELPRVLEVEVTPEDIERGKPREVRSCPIAFAAQRALGLDYPPRVAWGFIVALAPDKEEFKSVMAAPRWYLTEEARDFVARFDLDYNVEPFSFKSVLYGSGMTDAELRGYYDQ